MYFKAISVLSLLAASAAAQNSTSQDLPSLVKQLPPCAVDCYSRAAGTAKCPATDFACLCGSGRSAFTSAILPCIALSTCKDSDISSVSNLAGQICTDVANNPSPSELASASNIVTSALGTATAASASSTPTNAAVRPAMGLGAVGAAALVAFAL